VTGSAPPPIVHYCEGCRQPRAFRINHQVSFVVEEEFLPEQLTVAFCPTCSRPSVFSREIFGSIEDGDVSDYFRLYPPDKRQLTYQIPMAVKASYDEAVRCERAGAWMATATMARRALEAVAREYVPSGRNELFSAIRKMHEDGIISEELQRWANGLRFLGNLGAHPTATSVSAEDATFALDFLQALLEILYDLRPNFEAWETGRKKVPATALGLATATPPAADAAVTKKPARKRKGPAKK
jgi:hypothetical protein